ncbi:MAG: acyl-CoA dehydrogenase family protein [Rhodospirillaceae bacterium]
MTTVTRLRDVSPEEIVRRAVDVRTLISEKAAETEKARRVSLELADEMRERDFFRMFQPKRFGGLEYDLATVIRCVLEWSAADASIGWVCSLATVHQWGVAQFPLECQEDVWGDDPGTIVCGSYAPAGECVAVEGGYRITGEYHFASGVDIMGWALLGVFFPPEREDGPRQPGFVMVPKSDYTVLDNWHVVGLAGTGSKSIVCKDVFVPKHRRVTFAEMASGNSPGYKALQSALYRYPILSIIPFGISSPALGCLKGALEVFLDAMNSRTTRGAVVLGGAKVREFQAVQMRVGRAAANLKAARGMLFEQIEETRAKVVDHGDLLTVADRIENRIAQAKTVELSVEGLDQLFGAVGGQGLNTSQHIQRAWRDAHAIAHHISFNWDALSSMYGQHLMGLEPQGQY